MKVEDIQKVAVIGAGLMGQGITQNFSQAGISVRVVDVDDGALQRCLDQIDSNLAMFQEFDLLKENPSSIMSRIHPVPLKSIGDAIQNCFFVIEAIPEVFELKQELFKQLDSFGPDIILTSNTSSFTVSSLCEGLQYPGRVVGLHYFYPANIIPLVEIHRGKNTKDEAVKVVRDLMIRVGKKPVMVRKEIPGFIVNRIQSAYNREIMYLLEQGVATPEDLDIAAKASYGFRLACLGPLEIQDMNGLDTLLRAGTVIRKSLCNSTEPSSALAMKVEAGELGLKSEKGWYDYSGKSKDQIIDERNRKLLQQLILFNRVET